MNGSLSTWPPWGESKKRLIKSSFAQGLDPLNPFIHGNVGLVLYIARRYEEALEHFRDSLDIEPNFAWTHWHMGMAYLAAGYLTEAKAAFQKGYELSGGIALILGCLGVSHALLGDRVEARRCIDELAARARREHVSGIATALIYTVLGENDSAFEWLEKTLADRSGIVLWLKWPLFDALRSDSRFSGVLQRTGLPA
jgi:tetratricopeptide (TPR) repeat protein